MANSIVRLPLDYFGNPTKGKPIANGFVYVGEPDLDPELLANRKVVTLRQESGVEVVIQPADQPLEIGAGGYVLYTGSPVQVLTDGNYSIKATDSGNAQKFYVANVFDGAPALISDVTAGDAVVTAAFEAADTAITAAYEAADTAITVAYEAADSAIIVDYEAADTQLAADITALAANSIGQRTVLNNSITFAIAAATTSVVPFDTEIKDEAGTHDDVTNNSRITVPVGYNRIKLGAMLLLTWASGGIVAGMEGRIKKNGLASDYTAFFYAMLDKTNNTGNPRVSARTEWLDVIPGDYFEIEVTNNHNTSSMVVQNANGQLRFDAELKSI